MTKFYVETKEITKVITVSEQNSKNKSFKDNKCFNNINIHMAV